MTITHNAAQAVNWLYATQNPLGLTKEVFEEYNNLVDLPDDPVRWHPEPRTLDYLKDVLFWDVGDIDLQIGVNFIDTEDMIGVMLGDGKTWILADLLLGSPC